MMNNSFHERKKNWGFNKERKKKKKKKKDIWKVKNIFESSTVFH